MKYLFAILFSQAAFAGHSSTHIFLCNIVSFDKTEIKGQCDPDKPKRIMKIPREWLEEDDKLRMNGKIRFTLSSEQLNKWMAMNSPAKKGR